MDKAEAGQMFAKYLVNVCPECQAKVGELCDTGGVWIHLDRMKLIPDFIP